MKITPKANIQQSQNKFVNRIRTFFSKGKVKLKTLLCDVFEKKSARKLSEEEMAKYDDYLKKVLPKEVFDPNIKVEYTPPWVDMEGAIVKTRYYYPEDKKILDSLKTKEERSEFIEKLIREKRYFYKD